MVIEETLENYGHGTEITIDRCCGNRVHLIATIPSRGGEEWMISILDAVHLGISPTLTFASAKFGGLCLLPPSYIDNPNIVYGDAEADYSVISFTDVADKLHYIIMCGRENFEKIR